MKVHLRVRDLMSRPIALVRHDDAVGTAEVAMVAAECHHLPVVDHDGLLVGVVSRRDLSRSSAAEPLRVDEVMHAPVVTVRPGTPASHAAALLVEDGIGCVVVVDDERRPQGILTTADLLVAAQRALDGKRIKPRVRSPGAPG